jgi:CheY-like chemotaxis protein
MNKEGPIIVIEDDIDDQFLLTRVFKNLNYANQPIFFSDGEEALVYLENTKIQPFLILSDINMPKLDGFELRKKVFSNERLHDKCIPYLFFTTGANRKSVIEAYSMSVQGYFIKPTTLEQIESTLRKIIEYWKECIAPGEFL